MGAGVERIALQIDTSSNVTGASRAREEIELFNKVMAETNNNMVKAAQAVAQFRQQQDAAAASSRNAATAAASTATTTNAAQTASVGTNVAVGGAGATSTGTNAAGGAPGIARWANSVAAANQQLALTPNRARTAANAVGILANTAATGTFSVAGLATAVGNLAGAIATVSNAAKTVAAATWIGIILQIGATLYGFYEKWKGKNDEIEARVKGLRGEVVALGYELGRDKLGARIAEINARTDEEIERTKKISFHTGERIKLVDALNAKREREIELARQQEQDERRQIELRVQSARDEIGALARQASDMDPFLARGKEIQAQFAQEKSQLDEQRRLRQINESEYQRLLQTTADKRYYNIQLNAKEREDFLTSARIQSQIGDLNPITRLKAEMEAIEERRKKAIDAGVDETTAAKIAENEKRQLFQGTLQAAIRSNESFAKVAKRMLLEPIETYLEGLAVQQGIDAVASAASGNFVGAAAHAAAAAAAIAGARLVASMAGLTAGGATAGGAGGGGQFVPNGGQSGGNQTIIIQTIDPTSRGVISSTIYEINRAGMLNQPIVAPYGRPS